MVRFYILSLKDLGINLLSLWAGKIIGACAKPLKKITQITHIKGLNRSKNTRKSL